MNKKYELTDIMMKVLDRTVYRIRALRDIPEIQIKKGELGGWVESEYNLDQEGACWVWSNAVVCEFGRVTGDARVGAAVVSGRAVVKEQAIVNGFEKGAAIKGEARVGGGSRVYGAVVLTDKVEVFELAFLWGAFKFAGQVSICGCATLKNATGKPVELEGRDKRILIFDNETAIKHGCRVA